jgi:hypothetical protein
VAEPAQSGGGRNAPFGWLQVVLKNGQHARTRSGPQLAHLLCCVFFLARSTFGVPAPLRVAGAMPPGAPERRVVIFYAFR